jgi:hypothetical protein
MTSMLTLWTWAGRSVVWDVTPGVLVAGTAGTHAESMRPMRIDDIAMFRTFFIFHFLFSVA